MGPESQPQGWEEFFSAMESKFPALLPLFPSSLPLAEFANGYLSQIFPLGPEMALEAFLTWHLTATISPLEVMPKMKVHLLILVKLTSCLRQRISSPTLPTNGPGWTEAWVLSACGHSNPFFSSNFHSQKVMSYFELMPVTSNHWFYFIETFKNRAVWLFPTKKGD